MKFSWSKRTQILGGLIPVVILIDQATKVWAQSAFKNQPAVVFWNDLFRFEYAENPGAFLSLGAQFSDFSRILILNIAVGLFLLYVLYLILRKQLPQWQMLAFGLLLAGGIGNLIDRVFRGAVIDFMNMGFGSLRTGIFNVADMAIMAGLILMLLPESWLSKKH